MEVSPNAQACQMLNRMLRPADAILSVWGVSAADELKILWALLVGYFAVNLGKISGTMKSLMERVFGTDRFEFICKLTKVKHILCRFPNEPCLWATAPTWLGYWVVSPNYEPEVRQVFRPRLGEVVMDVGANVGAYTIRLARMVGEEGLIIALEPEPENFKCLVANMKLNKLCNVIALPWAAYERDGACILYGRGTGSSLEMIPEGSAERIEVPTTTLDTLVRDLNVSGIDWLKIDVEGAELSVLKGADNTLQITKNLIIEVWNKNAREVFNILEHKRYEVSVLSKMDVLMNVLARQKVPQDKVSSKAIG